MLVGSLWDHGSGVMMTLLALYYFKFSSEMWSVDAFYQNWAVRQLQTVLFILSRNYRHIQAMYYWLGFDVTMPFEPQNKHRGVSVKTNRFYNKEQSRMLLDFGKDFLFGQPFHHAIYLQGNMPFDVGALPLHWRGKC
jgi:hypothetical protein